MKSRAHSTGFFAGVALLSAPLAAGEFHLLCSGDGIAVTGSAATVYSQNSDGGTTTGTAYGTKDRPYSAEVNVDIVDGVGRVRLPSGILPPINSGKDGWFDLQDVKQSESEIVAKISVNFMNHPTMRISRITGAVSIDGKRGTFAGKCQPYDPATVQRAF